MHHIFRDADKCADFLANLGLIKSLGVHELSHRPKDLLNSLQADIIGVCLPRLCNNV